MWCGEVVINHLVYSFGASFELEEDATLSLQLFPNYPASKLLPLVSLSLYVLKPGSCRYLLMPLVTSLERLVSRGVWCYFPSCLFIRSSQVPGCPPSISSISKSSLVVQAFVEVVVDLHAHIAACTYVLSSHRPVASCKHPSRKPMEYKYALLVRHSSFSAPA